jgi:hypothetical protein
LNSDADDDDDDDDDALCCRSRKWTIVSKTHLVKQAAQKAGNEAFKMLIQAGPTALLILVLEELSGVLRSIYGR